MEEIDPLLANYFIWLPLAPLLLLVTCPSLSVGPPIYLPGSFLWRSRTRILTVVLMVFECNILTHLLLWLISLLQIFSLNWPPLYSVGMYLPPDASWLFYLSSRLIRMQKTKRTETSGFCAVFSMSAINSIG